ncbi:Glycosyltransferase, GT2 family [Lutibacter oricola]|uniref:Glycosyltransferase, GT2 family n=1 Tax=Lutibacter oricola TaxID=762486 RepID=A0A1H2X0B9_9FLAO|nr:glycosyltransferase family 2 protein [Lutibacter oricola]SDW85954.1 Glycosyltransferase, GT2 family [Lutibacter oricola]
MNINSNVFIVIATYNSIQWIEQCLNSIPKDCNTVIIDNNSSDNTVSFIKEKFPKSYLIEEKENLGFGKANNIGISYALNRGAEYIFLLNQDAYLEQDTISKLIQASKENPNYGILSPIHLNGNGSKLDSNFAVYIQQNRELQFDSLKGNIENKPYNVSFVNAASWFIPKNTFEKIGGFDPIFYHYGEDNNFCQRVIYHKLKVGVVPDVYIKHDREDRVAKKEQSFKEKLVLKERFYKSKWANINVNLKPNKIKKKKLKQIIKDLMLLRIKSAYSQFKEYRMTLRILPAIYKSRNLNKMKGKHYLKY